MADLATRARIERLRAESIVVARRFGPARFDQSDGTWFLIDQFPIARGWNQSHVAILLDIPSGTPGYPQIPLDLFWTDRELATDDGQNVGHFFVGASPYQGVQGGQEHYNKGWGHFCIHLRSWHPAPTNDLAHGDSILTYLEAINAVFRDRKKLAS